MNNAVATVPDRLMASERHGEAFKLRLAGYDYATIAERLGYAGKSSVAYALNVELERRCGRPCEDYRQVELARVDSIWQPLFERFNRLAADHDSEIKPSLVNQLLSISEYRSKLLGLTNPKFLVVPSQEDTETEAAPALPATPAAQLQTLLDKLRTRLAEQATPLEVVEHGPANVPRGTSESTTDDVARTSGIAPQCNRPDETKLASLAKFDTVSNMDEASLPKAPSEGG